MGLSPTNLHRGNLHTLCESVRELGGLGVESLKVDRLSCVGEGEALSEYAITAEEEYDAYLAYIPQYIEDGMPVPNLMLSGLFSARDGEFGIGRERHPEGEDCGNKVICGAARATMYLGPDGRILPCIPMSELEAASEAFPRIDEMTIAEALADSTYLSFITTTLGDYLRHNPECAECAYSNRCCGGCRGRAVLENGASDLMGVDPDACLVFKGGYYERVKAMLQS